MAQPHLFLSHSGKDAELASKVKAALQAAGTATVYLASHDPQPGTNLGTKLEREIKRSVALVVLLTENAAASGIVHQEIGIARGAGITVVGLVPESIGNDPAKLGVLNGDEQIRFDPTDPLDGILDAQRWLAGLAKDGDQRNAQAGSPTAVTVPFAHQVGAATVPDSLIVLGLVVVLGLILLGTLMLVRTRM